MLCEGGANITNVGDRKETPGTRVRLCPAEAGSVPILDLSREYRPIGPLLLKAVEAVFSSQNFIMGPQVAEFERAAQEKCGVGHAIGCSSGTDALWLALAGAGIGPGDAVSLPASAFSPPSAPFCVPAPGPCWRISIRRPSTWIPPPPGRAWNQQPALQFGHFCPFTSTAKSSTGTALRD